MADTKGNEITAADAAKAVKRTVVANEKGKDGEDKVVTKKVAVAASEVLDFKDYGTHVVVVTKDGRKLSSADDEA